MRDERRLNALARGRLRAQRSAEPRLPARDGGPPPPRRLPLPAAGESPAGQRLVAVLAPVIGWRDPAEPRAPATLLWLTPEC